MAEIVKSFARAVETAVRARDNAAMQSHIPPEFEKAVFQCPSCRVVARQIWYSVRGFSKDRPDIHFSHVKVVRCEHCEKTGIWVDQSMVSPDVSDAQEAHEDMPTDVLGDYNEARAILRKSPRGAAALLRLVIQKLMVHLGQPGKNINADIGELVKGGLPVQIQMALDTVRVVGNESVHPGVLSLNDNAHTAIALFGLVNFIVDNQIAQPKRLDELYRSLPAGALKGIADRDR